MNLIGLCEHYQVNNWEEAEQLLEEELFAIKQHFITKPWLRLTAKSRIQSLEKLAPFFEEEPFDWRVDFPEASITALAWWQAYQQAHIQLKRVIQANENPAAFLKIIDRLFEVEGKFLSQVPNFAYCIEEPVFGTEPDAMLIQKELTVLNSQGILTFAEIFEQRETVSKSLLLACKRWVGLKKYV